MSVHVLVTGRNNGAVFSKMAYVMFFFSKPSGSLYPAVHSTHEDMTDEQSSGWFKHFPFPEQPTWAKERMLLKSMYVYRNSRVLMILFRTLNVVIRSPTSDLHGQ